MPGTRKLGRKTAHRNLMLRGMVTYLLEKGSIETTLHRAKEVRALTDKMITLGKDGSLAARRAALAFITKEDVVSKLFSEIAAEYEGVNGGYTAVYKLGPRRGDGAEMALIRLTKEEKKVEEAAKAAEKKSSRKGKKADAKAEKAEEKPAPAKTEKTEKAEAKAEEPAKAEEAPAKEAETAPAEETTPAEETAPAEGEAPAEEETKA